MNQLNGREKYLSNWNKFLCRLYSIWLLAVVEVLYGLESESWALFDWLQIFILFFLLWNFRFLDWKSSFSVHLAVIISIIVYKWDTLHHCSCAAMANSIFKVFSRKWASSQHTKAACNNDSAVLCCQWQWRITCYG